MIPKVIHCVWLSGDEKPSMYKKCIESWKITMPDFKIIEWSICNLPNEVLKFPFVETAINERKWAFATDYIRLWALYNYGGVYLDMDVIVYKSFSPFLQHSAFSCIEFNPISFYKYIRKHRAGSVFGLNIEAAVLASEKGHPWIKSIMCLYDGKKFQNTDECINTMIMPLLVTKASIQYGFKYVPIYQVLKGDVHIYPSDTFSHSYNMNALGYNEDDTTENVTKYSRHLCTHSWYEEKKTTASFIYYLKKTILNIFGKSLINRIKAIFSRKNIIDSTIR